MEYSIYEYFFKSSKNLTTRSVLFTNPSACFHFCSDLVATLCALSKLLLEIGPTKKSLDFRTRTTTTIQVLTLSKRNPPLTIITSVPLHVDLLYGHNKSMVMGYVVVVATRTPYPLGASVILTSPSAFPTNHKTRTCRV